jgi:hypothetical protein
MARKIPIISLEDFETKSKKPLIMKTIVTNIAEGVEDNLETVSIAEIQHTDIIINVPKSEWRGGLEKAMEYYINTEEYEECSIIKKLIKKL